MDAPNLIAGLIVAAAVAAVLWPLTLWIARDEREFARREIELAESFVRTEAGIRRLRDERDRLARLVDSGDLDGARAMARGILEGEGKTHG